jgi:nucleoside-diphosphate-sugar epimerase
LDNLPEENGGTTNVVRAARQAASVRRFIYASTTSVYGPTSGIVDEASPCLPAASSSGSVSR